MNGWGQLRSSASDLLIQRRAQDGGYYSIHRGRTHPDELLICRDGKPVYTSQFSSAQQTLVDFCVTLLEFGFLLDNPPELLFIPREGCIGLEQRTAVPWGLRKLLEEEKKILQRPVEERPADYIPIQMQLGHIGTTITLLHSDLVGYLYSFAVLDSLTRQSAYGEVIWRETEERFQLKPSEWFRTFHHRPGSANSDLVFFKEYQTEMYEFYSHTQLQNLQLIKEDHYTQFLQSLDLDKRMPRYIDGYSWATQWQYNDPGVLVESRYQVASRLSNPTQTFPLEWVHVLRNDILVMPAEIQNGIQIDTGDTIILWLQPEKHCTNVILHSFAPISWRVQQPIGTPAAKFQSILEIPWLPMNMLTVVESRFESVNRYDILKLHINAEIW